MTFFLQKANLFRREARNYGISLLYPLSWLKPISPITVNGTSKGASSGPCAGDNVYQCLPGPPNAQFI